MASREFSAVKKRVKTLTLCSLWIFTHDLLLSLVDPYLCKDTGEIQKHQFHRGKGAKASPHLQVWNPSPPSQISPLILQAKKAKPTEGWKVMGWNMVFLLLLSLPRGRNDFLFPWDSVQYFSFKCLPLVKSALFHRSSRVWKRADGLNIRLCGQHSDMVLKVWAGHWSHGNNGMQNLTAICAF